MWVRRAYGNLQKYVPVTAYSEKMAIISFFIPFVNAFRGIMIIREIHIETVYKLKEINPDGEYPEDQGFISIWWGLIIVSEVLSRIALRSIRDSDTISGMIDSSRVFIWSNLFDILPALAGIYLIKTISELEQELYKFPGKGIFKINE